MQINNLKPTPSSVYFQHAFIILLESHLTYLRTSDAVTVTPVSSHQNYKYEGDLYGLLDDLNIPKKYHYIVMRFNGYESSTDFKGSVENLVLPNFNEIEILKAIYMTKNSF